MNQPEFERVRRIFREPSFYSEGLSDRVTPSFNLSLPEQYAILASHVGLVDRSFLAKLKLVGKDSVDLLQTLSTNDLSTLAPNSSAHTVLTTEKGRVIDLLTLYYLSNSDLILVCHAPPEKVFSWIERFIIMEDVSLLDLTTAYSMFSLSGPDVEKMLSVLGVNHLHAARAGFALETKVGGIQLIVGSAEQISPFNVNILAPAADAHIVWQRLLEDGSETGLRPCGIDALEIHRIEHGFPVYGRELTEEVNPLEAGLERFVSFTKGCYIGQEVIARLDTYKKLQKRLVGLHFGDLCSVLHGARIAAQPNDVGWVTSAAKSPRLNRTMALAYVRSGWTAPETSVDVTTESGTRNARVVPLPFEV